jgi:small subunit ribosomal protein S9
MTFSGNYHYANGKRKTSVARVRLYEQGSGQVVVNEKELKDWADNGEQVQKLISPLEQVGMTAKFDISIKVTGGGTIAQAEACRHGIAKALTVFDPKLRSSLKKIGFLSRDSRKKERKKYGLKSARRAPQFSKR